jgi:hypothetical protein
MITFIEQERIVALKQVTEERIAALNTITQAVSEERHALQRDIERVGVQLVDHAIWRLAELLAVVLVCLGVGTVGILLLVRKLFFRPESRPERPKSIVPLAVLLASLALAGQDVARGRTRTTGGAGRPESTRPPRRRRIRPGV